MTGRLPLQALITALLALLLWLAPPAARATPDLPAQAQPLARLVLHTQAGDTAAWAHNLLAGPVEVVLEATGPSPVNAQPALPARATVPARGRVQVARLMDGLPPGTALALRVVPGAPATRIRDVEYRWPLQSHQVRISQGWGGHYSHSDAENHYALDLAAAAGTPVLAARDGVVMQVERGFSEGRFDPALQAAGNFVRIVHDDGSMALYAHLAPDGPAPEPGRPVRRGEQIGLVGSTGFSSAPHLHFVVQANRGMRLEAIAFRMFGPAGLLRFSLPPAENPAD